MVAVQKRTAGSGSSITSIALGSNSHGILTANCESNLDGSDVALKVRKPYTISKQREKWTEEEHHKFIEALKLFGRAWRQIEDYIGTKTAVQIRSHAQKFFSKVTKEGANNAEASNEVIKIPPPRPKRKPLHPYPRKLAEAPNITRSCPNIQENGTSSELKILEREAQSPTSVLSPEGSHTSTPHLNGQGSGSVSPTSSSSNLSHVLDTISLVKSNLTMEEKERDLSLTLTLSGPSLNNDSTIMQAGKEFKGVELTNDDDVYSEAETIFVGGRGLLTTIKLFGHTVVVTKPLELSVGVDNVVSHTATRDLLMFSDSHLNPLVFEGSQTHVSSLEILDGQLVLSDIVIGERSREKGGSKNISSSGSNSDSINKMEIAEIDQDSGDSKIKTSHPPILNQSEYLKGFVPYKRCVAERESVLVIKTADGRESQLVCL